MIVFPWQRHKHCLSVSIQLIFCFQGFHDHKFCMNAFAQVTSQEEKLIVKTEMKFCSYNAVQTVNTFTILIWKLERIVIQHLADFCLVCVLYWKQWFWWLQKALSDFLWQKFWFINKQKQMRYSDLLISLCVNDLILNPVHFKILPT